jgi:hypothetical protein
MVAAGCGPKSPAWIPDRGVMENWPALTGVAALAFFCDRLLAWMGARGWIYWREPAAAPLAGPRPAPPRLAARELRPPRRHARRVGGRSRPRA